MDLKKLGTDSLIDSLISNIFLSNLLGSNFRVSEFHELDLHTFLEPCFPYTALLEVGFHLHIMLPFSGCDRPSPELNTAPLLLISSNLELGAVSAIKRTLTEFSCS